MSASGVSEVRSAISRSAVAVSSPRAVENEVIWRILPRCGYLHHRARSLIPIRVRLAIQHQPAPEECAVAHRGHAALFVERDEELLQAREVVERDAGKVVMLEVVVREEVDHVPKPGALH